MSDTHRTPLTAGDVLSSPSGTLVQLVERVARDPRWKTSGWRALRLNNGTGDGHGFTEFLSDSIAVSWRKIAVGEDWTTAPLSGGVLEERFVSTLSGTIQRELRRVTKES